MNIDVEKMLDNARYIDTQGDFELALAEMADADVLAIDTEFMREKTYYPELCLIQVASKNQAWCIDTLSIEDWKPFVTMCLSEQLTKILHSGRQDLEIFCLQSEQVPMPIFDTQLAATFTGRSDQISYAALIEDLFSVEIDKSQSRTDWSRRPLHKAQLTYALNDVVYLDEARRKLTEDLAKLGREQWFAEDSALLGRWATYIISPADAWQKVKGVGNLEEESFRRLVALAHWREEVAQRDNLPRSWVLKDAVLLNLAAQSDFELPGVEQEQLLSKKQIHLWGDELHKIFSADHGDIQIPPFIGVSRLDTRQKKLLKRVAECVKSTAENLSVPAPLIANRKQMERLIRGAQDSPVYAGWRGTLVGDEIREILASSKDY